MKTNRTKYASTYTAKYRLFSGDVKTLDLPTNEVYQGPNTACSFAKGITVPLVERALAARGIYPASIFLNPATLAEGAQNENI